jgi:uncharacterized protein (TIGR02588 family)
MSERNPSAGRVTSRDGHEPASRAGAGRKLAEWVTLGTSALLVLGVAGYLAYHATRQHEPHIAVDVRPLLDQVRHKEGQYILPVECRNLGDRTLQDFRGEVTYRGSDGSTERREFRIDYLGERATQTVYVYSERDPKGLEVRAQPLDYRLE